MGFSYTTRVVFVVMAVLLGIAALWNWLIKLWVQTAVEDFGRAIRRSRLSSCEKDSLLDQLEEIDGRLRAGCSVSFFWLIERQATIQGLLEHGITKDEVRFVERELRRFERGLVQ